MVPDRLARNVVSAYGSAGSGWLQRLPELIADCERRWSVTAETSYADLTYSYVAPGMTAGGRDVVLKLGVPHRDTVHEIEALRIFDGRGCARLLESDAERGVMVLERVGNQHKWDRSGPEKIIIMKSQF